MSEHTPGPWTYVDGVVVAVARDKVVTVTVEGEEREHHDGLLALVYGDHDNADHHYTKDANARLIAAAPDLLRELHAMVEWVERETDGRDWPHGRLEAARAAIAKSRPVSAPASERSEAP